MLTSTTIAMMLPSFNEEFKENTNIDIYFVFNKEFLEDKF